MELQHERDGDMVSQGIGWGVTQPPKPIRCGQMSMGKPLNPQLPTVLCTQSFISFRSWLRELIHWEEKGMEV